MVDCRECRYYKEAIIRDWDGDSIKERKYCNSHDNAIILKTVYSECKVWTSKEGDIKQNDNLIETEYMKTLGKRLVEEILGKEDKGIKIEKVTYAGKTIIIEGTDIPFISYEQEKNGKVVSLQLGKDLIDYFRQADRAEIANLQEDIEVFEDKQEEITKEYNELVSDCDKWHKKAHMALNDNTFLKNKIKALEEENLKLKEENKELQLIREEKNKDTLNRVGIQEKARYLNKACEHNFDLLATIAMEEMAELTQVLSKIIRNSNTSVGCWSNPYRANFIEEIADVQLCLERIKDWNNITESEVNTIILEKINRTIKRMGIK